MTIQNVLDWLQEAEDNNCWRVSTQSVKRLLEEVQKKQLTLTNVSQQSELLLMAICEFTKRNTQKDIKEVEDWIEKRFNK